MSDIDDYRRGYEDGQKVGDNPVDIAVATIGHGVMAPATSDAYSKGFRDGMEGNSFDPPEDD